MKVEFAQRADRDLEAVGDWIGQDNPRQAERCVRELRQHCAGLGQFPHRVAFADPERWPGIRKSVYGNYLIFLEIDDAASLVRVLHVLHGARDWERILTREQETGE